MLLVIPDTNILFSDQFLEGALVNTILAAEDRSDIRLVIPEIVVDELRNLVEERLEATIKGADRLRHDFAKLSGLSPYSVDIMISCDQRKAVLDRFESRIQQLAKEGRILNYPSPSPKELAHRSIKVKVPFREEDRGMRDTLIWLTAKDCAVQGTSTGSKVILVSKDKAFWDEKKKSLNESLVTELEDAGIPLDSITILDSLQNVIDTFISGKLPDVEWVKGAIERGQIDDFTTESDKVLISVTDWINHNAEILDVGGYLLVEFDVVEEVSLDSIERALDLGSGEVLVESEWICNVSAEGYGNPHFGNNLRVELRFKLSSIVKIDNDPLSVISHEVTDMEVVYLSETQHAEFRGVNF